MTSVEGEGLLEKPVGLIALLFKNASRFMETEDPLP
jgi:hypothetical protein